MNGDPIEALKKALADLREAGYELDVGFDSEHQYVMGTFGPAERRSFEVKVK